MSGGTAFNFRNILILLGIIITGVGLVYFAAEFIDLISDWGKLLSLVLLATIFVSLGAHFESGRRAGEPAARAGARWRRVATALYVLGLLTALVGVVFFLGMDQVPRVVRVLASILLGLGLILVAARRYGTGDASADRHG